jgi:hypothetical protein
MTFFCLFLFLPILWFGSWSMGAFAAFFMGMLLPQEKRTARRVGGALAIAWVALAYMEDVMNFQLISHRLAPLLHLPKAELIFPLLAFLAFTLGYVGAKAGAACKSLYTHMTKSAE